MVGNDYTVKLICRGYAERESERKVIITTSISFYLGNRKRGLPTNVIASRVGKLSTRMGKLKIKKLKLKKLCAEFSPKVFAHPGLKPCRRP